LKYVPYNAMFFLLILVFYEVKADINELS